MRMQADLLKPMDPPPTLEELEKLLFREAKDLEIKVI